MWQSSYLYKGENMLSYQSVWWWSFEILVSSFYLFKHIYYSRKILVTFVLIYFICFFSPTWLHTFLRGWLVGWRGVLCDNTEKLLHPFRVLQQDDFGDTNGCIHIRSPQLSTWLDKTLKNIVQLGVLWTIYIHTIAPISWISRSSQKGLTAYASNLVRYTYAPVVFMHGHVCYFSDDVVLI